MGDIPSRIMNWGNASPPPRGDAHGEKRFCRCTENDRSRSMRDEEWAYPALRTTGTRLGGRDERSPAEDGTEASQRGHLARGDNCACRGAQEARGGRSGPAGRQPGRSVVSAPRSGLRGIGEEVLGRDRAVRRTARDPHTREGSGWLCWAADRGKRTTGRLVLLP